MKTNYYTTISKVDIIMRAENIPEKHVHVIELLKQIFIMQDVIDTREWKIPNDVVVFITNTKEKCKGWYFQVN